MKNYAEIAVAYLAEIIECIDSDGTYAEKMIRMIMEYNSYTRKQAIAEISKYRQLVETYNSEKK